MACDGSFGELGLDDIDCRLRRLLNAKESMMLRVIEIALPLGALAISLSLSFKLEALHALRLEAPLDSIYLLLVHHHRSHG